MFRAAHRLPLRFAVVAATVSLAEPKEKLSIYPSPTADILLVDSPSKLEREIGKVRRRAQGIYCDTHAHVQGWVSKWISMEHAVENRVKSIIAPSEPLTPGILYVGIATLSGSIIAHKRSFPVRFLLPPLFLIASARHFLPKTTHNLSSYFGSLEDEYFPTFAEKHEVAKAHSAMTWQRMKDTTHEGRQWMDDVVESTIDKVQEFTGLKIRETLQRVKKEERPKSENSERDKS